MTITDTYRDRSAWTADDLADAVRTASTSGERADRDRVRRIALALQRDRAARLESAAVRRRDRIAAQMESHRRDTDVLRGRIAAPDPELLRRDAASAVGRSVSAAQCATTAWPKLQDYTSTRHIPRKRPTIGVPSRSTITTGYVDESKVLDYSDRADVAHRDRTDR